MNHDTQDVSKATNDHGMDPSMERTVCVDLDGVIADFYNCRVGCRYDGYPNNYRNLKRSQCPVSRGARESLLEIHERFRIIILTARIEAERQVTERWLEDNMIPYDELIMGKPRAFIYIDDFAFTFRDWKGVMNALKVGWGRWRKGQ